MEVEESVWTEETLCAYLAAFLDSDGSIGISRNGARAVTFRLRVSIYNNNPEPLEFMQDHFGGTIHSRSPKYHRAAKHTQYTLVWQAKTGYELLRKVLPYMVAKKYQAGVAIRFHERNLQDGFNGHADKSWQEDYYFDMKTLNAKFYGGEKIE